MIDARIESARAVDMPAVCALLEAAGLPTDGLLGFVPTTLVARDVSLAACVALEPYGHIGLLRSLTVAPRCRGRGIGRRMVRAALAMAGARRVSTVFLLTTDASDFFARHYDFRPIDRAMVARRVRESIEFVSACPSAAQAMTLEISP